MARRSVVIGSLVLWGGANAEPQTEDMTPHHLPAHVFAEQLLDGLVQFLVDVTLELVADHALGVQDEDRQEGVDLPGGGEAINADAAASDRNYSARARSTSASRM